MDGLEAVTGAVTGAVVIGHRVMTMSDDTHCISQAFTLGCSTGGQRQSIGGSISTTHLTILQHGIFDQDHDPCLLILAHRVVVFVARADGELGAVRTEGESGDGGRVFRVQLHALLGGVIPDGDEAVGPARRERVVTTDISKTRDSKVDSRPADDEEKKYKVARRSGVGEKWDVQWVIRQRVYWVHAVHAIHRLAMRSECVLLTLCRRVGIKILHRDPPFDTPARPACVARQPRALTFAQRFTHLSRRWCKRQSG